jgi:SAM-dependent MidA family methyltransferase
VLCNSGDYQLNPHHTQTIDELNALGEKILREILRDGPISFRRFMELALYCPEYGFYEKEPDTIGRSGNYITSVSVGGLFGRLLASQFARWFGGHAGGLEIVEAGAHDGRLLRDILEWFELRKPELSERLRVMIIEPSARREAWQRKTLEHFSPRIRWIRTLGELPPSGDVRRVIFSNELLDALPVHRLGWDAEAQAWREWLVEVREGHFVWRRSPTIFAQTALADSWLATLPAALRAVLPEDYTVEFSPAATDWWSAAARAVAGGRLLTFDYGLTTPELLRPERTAGTLRSYRRHRLMGDVLSDPGEQDITAHVNFSALQVAGECAGLRTECLKTQERFLTRIAAAEWELAGGGSLPDETERRQFHALTHPTNLGQSFRVLVQSRG